MLSTRAHIFRGSLTLGGLLLFCVLAGACERRPSKVEERIRTACGDFERRLHEAARDLGRALEDERVTRTEWEMQKRHGLHLPLAYDLFRLCTSVKLSGSDTDEILVLMDESSVLAQSLREDPAWSLAAPNAADARRIHKRIQQFHANLRRANERPFR